MDEEAVVWAGRYLVAKRRGRWEYVARPGPITAAVILAIDDGHVLLVEQYRVPLSARCLELPAGLVGDEDADEPIMAAAARELVEETGWSAAHLDCVGEFATSPGMASETFTLVRAHQLTRVGDGGGVAGEQIVVHRVPIATLAGFVAAKRAEGVVIDAKLLMLLGPTVIGGFDR